LLTGRKRHSEGPAVAEPKAKAARKKSNRPVQKAKAIAKKDKAIATKAIKIVLPFPGVPKKAKAPASFKDFTVYSDLKKSQWRVMKTGRKKDVGASWKQDPHTAWNKVNKVLAGVIKIPSN
jgi:hypothetical protein